MVLKGGGGKKGDGEDNSGGKAQGMTRSSRFGG